ncbi:hypothetical protein [Nocardioides lacusdianchii]|uniref:hypothetical protein n=1 Tax=Nocardioides lacusdianchii TaxID=2783664 RepID=UPI001CCA69C4|nr:hypothetical protein [Nocardioides lacusdianchii]
MPGAASLVVALRPLLPLQIRAVENDPTLVEIGDRWSLALNGNWTWRRDSGVVTSWGHPSAEDAVWDLCGSKVIGIYFPDPAFDGDCSFRLTTGSLDITSDRSGWETWTFHHDDLDVVFVGH